MLESLRKQASGFPSDAGHRVAVEASLPLRAMRAALGGGAVLALLLLALESRVFSGLPGYPAAVLVFLCMVVVPGLLLNEALLPRSSSDFTERLVLAFPLGLAIAAPAGLAALWLNLSLDAFLRIHIVVATAASAGSLFIAPPDWHAWLLRTVRGWNGAALVLLLFVAVAVGGILSSPSWGGDRLARTFDEWRYMTYVNSYLQQDKIDALHPVGIGEAPYPRMEVNTWVVVQAGVARAAGVDAEAVVLDDMTPLLAVFALGATYFLAKGLFRSRGIALLAVLIQLGIALTDFSRDEGLGLNILLRIAEDKFVATNILFPVGLLFAAMFISRPRLNSLLTFVLIGLAIFVVHPQPLFFLGISILAFALLRATVRRSWAPVGWAALLAVPVAAFNFGELLCWHIFNTSWPALFNMTLTWREEFKLVHLPGGLIMGNFHLLLHPSTLAGLALAPLILLRVRKASPHQMLAAATLGWLPLFFVPPLTTAAAKLVSASLMVRLPLIAPVAVILAYAVYAALHWTNKRWPVRSSAARVAGAPIKLVAPAVLGALVLIAGLIIQDLYYPADQGTYFGWASRSAIVPATDHSIFLGGKDRMLSREWRLKPEDREVFSYLDEHAAPGSTVLMPEEMSFYLPGIVWSVKPAYSQGILGQWDRPAAQSLYRGALQGSDLRRALDDASIDYVVVQEVSNAGQAMAALASAQMVVELGPYQIFDVQNS